MSSDLPEPRDWRRTSPFAAVHFFGSTLKTIVSNYTTAAAVIGSWAVILRSATERLWPEDGSGPPSVAFSVGLAIAATLLVVGVVAALRYWRFQFKVEDDRILIRQGVLKRSALDLPFDRIQGINVDRSLLDRVLGLVTIRLDTAGTGAAEGQLPSVKGDLADQLRARVNTGAQPAAAEQPGAAATRAQEQGDQPAATARATPEAEPLLRLGGVDMVCIALSDTKVFAALGALFVVGGAFVDMVSFERTADLAEGIRDGFAQGVGGVAIGVVVVFLVAIAVLVRTVLRHHDFTLWRQAAAYRSRAGLLTQKEVVVETPKIQHVDASQDLVLRWMRRYRLTAPPVGRAIPDAARGVPPPTGIADNLAVPLIDGPTAEKLRSQIFGDEGRGLTLLPFADGFKRVSPHYIRSLALRIGGIPVIAAAALVMARFGPAAVASVPFAFACAAWALLALLISLQAWRRRGYLHDSDGLASRTGLAGAKVAAFLYRKAQSATVKQSPLQRRKGLATLEVLLASDTVTVPWIDHADALALRDYILYVVESSRRRWH